MPASLAALCALLVALAALARAEKLAFDILVPPFPVKGNDAYICTTVPFPERPYKLTGVEPIAEQNVVHHILLFGEVGECLRPAHARPRAGAARLRAGRDVWREDAHGVRCGPSW